MQDRFAIGPVTIVQLVGLTTKPRIVSAHVDTAVRPADNLPPPSAVAGLSADMEQSVREVESSFFDLKTPAGISMTAPAYGAGIAFESAVDRPASDGGGSPQSLPQFTALPDNIDLAALIAQLRGAQPSNPCAAAPPSTPPVVETSPADTPANVDDSGTTPPQDTETPSLPADSTAIVPGAAGGEITTGAAGEDGDAIFDGLVSYGDDAILDFEAYYAESGLLPAANPAGSAGAEADFAVEIASHAAIGAAYGDFIDFAAAAFEDNWPESGTADHVHHPSASDAVIVPL